jgi:small subunit ribosomal protein S20
MANHKSSIKRIRTNNRRRDLNSYQTVTARTSIKKVFTATDKKEAQAMLPKVHSLLDRLAKKHIIHKNKASNLKSELALHVSKMK